MFSKQKGNFYRVLEKNKDPEFPKFLILLPLFFRTQMKHFSAKWTVDTFKYCNKHKQQDLS